MPTSSPAIMSHTYETMCLRKQVSKRNRAKRLHYATRHNSRPLLHITVSTATFHCANTGRALEEPSVSSGRWLWRQKQRRTCGVSHHDAHWGIDTNQYQSISFTTFDSEFPLLLVPHGRPRFMTIDQVHTTCILKYGRSSPNIIRAIRSRRKKWAGSVACNGRIEMHSGFWWGNLNERERLQELRVHQRIILKWNFKNQDGRVRNDLIWHTVGTSGRLL